MTGISAWEDKTRRLTVAIVVGCGIVASLQIGKVAIAAPMLQSEFSLNLAAVGWMTSIFAVIGLVGGIPFGALVARVGDRRTLIFGLGAIVLGAAIGAKSSSFFMFLFSRVLESLGFLLITIAGPAVLQRVVPTGQRNIAFALWSCFMPTGIALAMVAGPLFTDWKTIWWTCAFLAATLVVATYQFIEKTATPSPVQTSMGADTLAVVGKSGPVLLALCFAFYSLMFFALFSFLPVLLMERMGVTHGIAGLLSALATAVNIIGNLFAGYFLTRGTSRPVLIAFSCVTMGVSAVGIFLPLFGDTATFLLCLVFSVSGGLIPATLLSSVPTLAPSTRLAPLVMGLLMQGSNLGLIVGPVTVGSVIDGYGWPAALIVVVIAALMATFTAFALRRSFPSNL
ncbi:CynX/NimT family MFS transporter [Kiloniella laminariae]|uniref:MFS transporter n=1 Tax=Kiloniella laminariae TaxID=454162 RepID=UPI000686F895|nr:MFS transporter [Kiloniella laminariae]